MTFGQKYAREEHPTFPQADYHDVIFWQIVEELDTENADEKPSYVFPMPDGLDMVVANGSQV